MTSPAPTAPAAPTPRPRFVDAYIAVSMQARGLVEIYSWDADFDKIPGVVRIEPPRA